MKFKSRYLQPVLSEGDEKEAETAGGAAPARNGFPVAAAAADATPLPQGPPTATLAYRYPEAFTVDLENGCVRFGFRCLIPGSEGAGTQFLYFDTAGQVSWRNRRHAGGRKSTLCSCVFEPLRWRQRCQHSEALARQ